MELSETVDLMLSSDYKDRLKAEIYQLRIRLEKLHDFNIRIKASKENTYGMKSDTVVTVEEPQHDCPEHMLYNQEDIMRNLLHILEERAVIENVEL